MLLSKPIRKRLLDQKPLQKSYDAALDGALGKDANPSTRNLYKKRDKEKALNAIKDLTLLADGFSVEDYKEVFSTAEFKQMIRASLGFDVIDQQEKLLKELIAKAKDLTYRLDEEYRHDHVAMKNEQQILENQLTLIKKKKERRQKQDEAIKRYLERAQNLSEEYSDKHREVENTLRQAEAQLKELRMPFSQLRTETAVTLGRTAIECCIKQYSQIETIGILAQPGIEFLERAGQFMSGIAQKVKESS